MMPLLAFCLWFGEEAESDQGCDQSLSNPHALLGQLEAIGLKLISLCVTIVLEIHVAARQGTNSENSPQGGRLMNTFQCGTSPRFLKALPTWTEHKMEDQARSDCIFSGMRHE